MNKNSITIIILSIIVFLTVIYGYLDGGSPKSAQNKRFDNIRVQDTQTIRNIINSYFKTNNTLPKTILEASKDYRNNVNATIPTDPETKMNYEYIATSSSEFKICTTYSESTLNDKSGMPRDFAHPSGFYCYSFIAGTY